MNLKISDLSFKYSSGKQVLDGVNFQAESGKCTFLLGANGAGKTTLFSNILGLLTPSFGKITLDDADLSSLKPREKAKLLGYVPQNVFFPSGSAFDAVLLGRRPYIRWGVTENDLSVVEKLFKDLSVEDFAMRNVDSLSGGEKQKIAIARALAQEPQVLLFDELTSNLDVKNQADVLSFIKKLTVDKNVITVAIVHDLSLALRFADVLNMTVEEACVFFANVPKIARRLQTLMDVGLGYITLGQSATTLSGGEAQRVKLALELARRETGRTVYVLDEPSTGLHVADVHKLIGVLDRLVESGNTVVIIEHNLDIIKRADHIIDLGPEGGSEGGTVVATGTPEEVAANPASYTGRYLKPILERDRE